MHMVRQIKEKMGEYGVSPLYLFVNFKAAYDSTDRMSFSRLWRNFHSLEN
jgi:hypothetical protein